MNYSVTADPQKAGLLDEADSSLQEIHVITPSPLSLKEAVILGETVSEEWPA
ncbi:MAG: hypothetical protein IBJ00_07040 [Alphaproteobacteria bacterium]|nr:hypothetical protein [Alphaproteobacteria bacterium]